MFTLKGFAAFICFAYFFHLKTAEGSEIINGKEVVPHSLPYMALLMSKTPVCGGMLIDPQWVLTAAHCSGFNTVLLGVHKISGDDKKVRQTQKVKKSIPHPCFDPTEKQNDLMLLKLSGKVKKTKWVQFLKLEAQIKDPAAGSSCMAAGWGITNNNSKKNSDVLMSVNVTVVDRAKCNSADYYNLKPYITKSMICAGSDGKTVADTCSGDSGGPLICKGVLVGVTSFGHKCGVMKKPGVYSFLTENQLKWIKMTMRTS